MRAQLFQALLVPDAEPLFLVDDDQPEVPEHDILLQQPVRTDHDIDRPRRCVFQNSLGVLRGLKTREQGDARREGCEPLGKVVIMLMREQRRRDQDGDLAILFDGLECRAHRDFGFPYPTSPHTRRSIGRVDSMSRLMSSMALT